MTLKEVANKFKLSLTDIYDEDEAQAIFLIALNHLFKYSRADYLFKKDELISVTAINEFETILIALQNGKPIQYIIGETLFYGLPFKVSPAVLIPRPETEELVEWVLSVCSSQLPNNSLQPLSILDIGTGSGCIAIALKKNLPDTKVYALDIAADSLALAEQNAKLNDVEVAFILDDILQSPYAIRHTQYSIIVSNPPYIKEDEKPAMHNNVLQNEPHRALFVSNEKPLIFYEAIADFALNNLKANGLLFFEINEYLGKQTVELLKDKGFVNIELRKDIQGKDRMIKATNP